MTDTITPKVAIISSLTGGLGHYCAHLANPLSKYCYIKFITYPQVDLTGAVVKQITDSFVRRYIKWPRFDLDESNPLSVVSINEYLAAKGVNIINIHVGTTVKRKIIYFIALCVYAKRLNSKKLIFTLHDVLPFEDDKKLVKLLKVFYSLADYFTVGNDLEKKKLVKYFEIPESKIDIIPHGIYNLFGRNLYTQAMARGYLDIPRKKKVILFFGFLREYKGLEYLIKAAGILSKKPDNNFLVYVASALKYAPRDLVERCLELINKLNLQEKFVLNLNYLDSLDIEAIFKASDLVALPYTYASQSGVLNMAMGFKKPVVVTDAFYDKIWIENKAGIVAKSKDAQSLAQNIQILLGNDRLGKQYGEFGFRYTSRHFNWDIVAKKYANVYHKVIK